MNYGLREFFDRSRKCGFGSSVDVLEKQTEARFLKPGQGDFKKWESAFTEFPELINSRVDFEKDAVIVTNSDFKRQEELRPLLMKYHPWRKGPFNFFGVEIDTEWRSNLKWDRILKTVQPLKDRKVLDLGCGNGYYLWRMLGEGAEFALGIDPSWLYFFQFQIFKKYIQSDKAMVLPLGIEDLPAELSGFDTVFSMGLLYHRRDPIQHCQRLIDFLKPGGECVLETLVVDGKEGDVLHPFKRYAKMGNVWNIPSCPTVELWLKQCGFENVRCMDVTVTTSFEQRKTAWMKEESLTDFLNPSDPTKTIEGYPAPKRAVFVANKG